ncbi:hypothetical protein CLOSTMETH_01552 [[Clostridium] methylpentosum DSM 5476]|uniref:Uncharacterized protein n=1 Tax=[Clostridium] methylpentosum DSM 5476 TaxID=537013 RepID=C0ECI0_9FIRM|nr:hypothetical protein CLOSTMETH_01552 [[Clostridium] methylpentosum DSM 5476]
MYHPAHPSISLSIYEQKGQESTIFIKIQILKEKLKNCISIWKGRIPIKSKKDSLSWTLLFLLFAVSWPAGIYLIWKKIKLEPVDFSKPIRSGLLGGKAEIIYSVFFLASSSVALVSGCLEILSRGFPDAACRLVVSWGCISLSLTLPGRFLCKHGMRLICRKRYSEHKRSSVSRDK